VLRKLREFAAAGATIAGLEPKAATGLKDYPVSDAEVGQIVAEMWGSGRAIASGAREALAALGVHPDFQSGSVPLDFIHRRAGNADIYFVANRSTNSVSASCTFRVRNRVPELWNAVTGERRVIAIHESNEAGAVIPLDFNPCGSWFVIFRETGRPRPAAPTPATPARLLAELTGPWNVSFDTNWGGPASVQFDSLASWTEHFDPAIKFFSGTATYTKVFELSGPKLQAAETRVLLDLGRVHEIAEVRVNGQACGVVWTPPFRVDVTEAVKPGANKLDVEVVNFWPNRIIGDAGLPKEKRLTRTNIRKLTEQTPLMPSGMLGPVRLMKIN
jgi:hypothetical protein